MKTIVCQTASFGAGIARWASLSHISETPSKLNTCWHYDRMRSTV